MKFPSLSLSLLPIALLVGCASRSTTPDFTLAATPATVSLQAGGSPRSLSVTVGAVGNFTSAVSVAVSGLPAGVTATPASLTLTPGQIGQFKLVADASTAAVSPTISIVGTQGALSHTATATLTTTAALGTASLSARTFDFGYDLVGSSLTSSVVTVSNTGVGDITLGPKLSGDPAFALNADSTCAATLAAGSSCTEKVSYTPTAPSGSTPQTATLDLGLGRVASGTLGTVTLTGTSAALAHGTVSPTINPQVAQYTMALPVPGSMTVNFGLDTTYGKQTWSQSTATAGGTVSMYVAGMLPNSTYHMQATVQLANGVTVTDVDHTFTTGAPELATNLTTTTTDGQTPQPGVEEITPINGHFGLAVTDLQGRVIWSYVLPNDSGGDAIEGAKLMSNGHFLVTIGQGSSYGLNGTYLAEDPIIAIRELDLAGNIVREISAADLTHELQAKGINISLEQFHHDVTPLPNGHWLVLSNSFRSFTDLPGYPGTTRVLGDVIIDLDQNLQPAWVWNEFDHLDVNRHPWNFPDWTHTNAVIYSPSDHNIIVSMRHQNWVVKVNYNDGAGSGDILWHLGEGGDFQLVGGRDPDDWFYAQHAPSLFSTNSSGVFELGLMDNGDDRIFPAGINCGQSGAPPCLYTTIPVFSIDEGAKTATFTFHQYLDPSLYSNFGGNTELLANGDIEYDLAGVSNSNSDIFEVKPGSTPRADPQPVWHMHSDGAELYRGYRLPSLYPGVQW